MAQELCFEVRRQKSHYFIDADDNQTVQDLKMMIGGIVHLPANNMELWKIDDHGNRSQVLHDTATLQECGYTPSNAKAQQPAPIGLRLTSDEHLAITEVSTPPPIPDTMRQEAAPTD
ncbi:unnamed protein product [Caenorhabditis sp. 36 PRJEB53466]|nr:unnamed protein product [Caenorhabditis sp. 36 PRJEB53466]